MLRRLGVVAATLAFVVGSPLSALADPTVITNTAPPTVVGSPALGESVVADPGTWDPEGVTYAYQWLVDGAAVDGATSRHFSPSYAELGHALSVAVTATLDDGTATATSDPVTVAKGTMTAVKAPAIIGALRYTHVVKVRPGTWSSAPTRVRVQWLRDGAAIKGATGRTRRLTLQDFGHIVQVRITAQRKGFHAGEATSDETKKVDHRVAVRHVVRYHVETRGAITAHLATFKTQAQQTYNDPRGWRGSGVKFVRVAKGGSLTLVLAQAASVPGFSSACSSEWSCRVGRYVIINQTRWQSASPMWNAHHLALRDYRHMVVNHESGHWLGHDHRSCPKAGALAPVMQQQSKGLNGCRPNPWPTVAERRTPRFG